MARIAVLSGAGAARELAEALAASGVAVGYLEGPPPVADASPSQAIATALEAFEGRLEASRPDGLLLAGSSDAALAAALVAAKLGLPFAWLPGSEDATSAELIGLLADLEVGANVPELEAWASTLPA